ncbi:hypothetical protein AHF37_10590 [Paragonimus kellicotti]|nr:hypothetical protein AHF37_10590 [Paragonimus kellicotti]
MTSSHHCLEHYLPSTQQQPEAGFSRVHSANSLSTSVISFGAICSGNLGHTDEATREEAKYNDRSAQGKGSAIDLKCRTLQLDGTMQPQIMRIPEKEPQRNSFMKFLKRGFSIKSRRRAKQTETDNEKTSQQETFRSVSRMPAQLSKCMAMGTPETSRYTFY